LGVYFKLFFVTTDVGNLYTDLGGYFEISCVMAEVGNLNAKLGDDDGNGRQFLL
jgi:hypothetical protein